MKGSNDNAGAGLPMSDFGASLFGMATGMTREQFQARQAQVKVEVAQLGLVMGRAINGKPL